MTEENPDQRVARALGMSPEQIGIIRDQWNEAPNTVIVRAIITDRLQQQISELERKLRKVDAAGLPALQGAIDAYERSISTIKGRL